MYQCEECKISSEGIMYTIVDYKKLTAKKVCSSCYVELSVLKRQDNINQPKHYTSHPSGIECIEITEHMNFNLGNVIKYIFRHDEKGKPLEDLKKAQWYLNREIERLEHG